MTMTGTTGTAIYSGASGSLELGGGVPAIYGQVAEIMAGLGKIAKSGKGPAAQGGYAFMPVDAIVAKLNELLVEHGVVVGSKVLDEELVYESRPQLAMDGTPTGRVDTKSRARIRVRYSFISALDGSKHKVVSSGEAHDVADKALGKAETAAYKKALLRTFTVVSGEVDPDAEDGTGPAEQVGGRRNRGQQRVDKARAATPPTAPLPDEPSLPSQYPIPPDAQPQPRVAPEPAPAPTVEEPTKGEPDEEDVRAGQTEAEAAELAARTESGPRRRKEPRNTSAPAEEPEPAWSPDPADVAYAEAEAPKPPAAPQTQAESKSATVAEVKSELRRAWSGKGMTRDQVNELGTEVTGKPLTQWMLNLNDLRKVLAAVEAR